MEKLTYKEIYTKLLNKPDISPIILAEYLNYLAGEYSYFSEIASKLAVEEPQVWSELRKVNKTDTATDKAYLATEAGKDSVKVKYRLKGLEKLMSAIKTRIRIAEGESFNRY